MLRKLAPSVGAKAARRLAKKEYAKELSEALGILTLAYRSAGPLWAARATAVFSSSSIAIESEQDSQLNSAIISVMEIFAWITLELRHLPDFLSALHILHGCLSSLPLTDESKQLLGENLENLDLAFTCVLINVTDDDLARLEGLSDVLEASGLYVARTALMYALGYEDELRRDGSLPAEEPSDVVYRMLTQLANWPISNDFRGPLITNVGNPRVLQSTVLGMDVEISFGGTTLSVLPAEAVLASIEACLATAFELKIYPHTERFHISIVEQADIDGGEPSFDLDPLKPEATLKWSSSRSINSFERSAGFTRFLLSTSMITMAATCVWRGGMETLDSLAENETVVDRVTMIAATANSYHRLFSEYVGSLDRYSDIVQRTYPPRAPRPVFTRRPPDLREPEADLPTELGATFFGKGANHRKIQMLSVIDYNAWNKAGWSATAYVGYGNDRPPGIALRFTAEPAARSIFERWRQRFGEIDRDDAIYLAIVTDVSDEHPAHYNVLVTSNHPPPDEAPRRNAMVLSRFSRTMPDNDANLRRFLTDYEKAGAYFLMPAIGEGDAISPPIRA